MSSKLLRSGTVLVHDEHDHVNVMRNTDVLIQGNKIIEISQNIQAPVDTEIIDCADKLISPGLIDTRRFPSRQTSQVCQLTKASRSSCLADTAQGSTCKRAPA